MLGLGVRVRVRESVTYRAKCGVPFDMTCIRNKVRGSALVKSFEEGRVQEFRCVQSYAAAAPIERHIPVMSEGLQDIKKPCGPR